MYDEGIGEELPYRIPASGVLSVVIPSLMGPLSREVTTDQD